MRCDWKNLIFMGYQWDHEDIDVHSPFIASTNHGLWRMLSRKERIQDMNHTHQLQEKIWAYHIHIYIYNGTGCCMGVLKHPISISGEIGNTVQNHERPRRCACRKHPITAIVAKDATALGTWEYPKFNLGFSRVFVFFQLVTFPWSSWKV
jgi:hypothetical protein